MTASTDFAFKKQASLAAADALGSDEDSSIKSSEAAFGASASGLSATRLLVTYNPAGPIDKAIH
jgi:hypothetical protein